MLLLLFMIVCISIIVVLTSKKRSNAVETKSQKNTIHDILKTTILILVFTFLGIFGILEFLLNNKLSNCDLHVCFGKDGDYYFNSESDTRYSLINLTYISEDVQKYKLDKNKKIAYIISKKELTDEYYSYLIINYETNELKWYDKLDELSEIDKKIFSNQSEFKNPH